jgi:hypothetical protein
MLVLTNYNHANCTFGLGLNSLIPVASRVIHSLDVRGQYPDMAAYIQCVSSGKVPSGAHQGQWEDQ